MDLDEVEGGDRGRRFVADLMDTERHGLPDRLVDEVERLGAGHPLATVELLRDLVRRGQVAPDRTGKLILVGQIGWPTLPDRLVRLLEGQVADLPDELASLLEAAAVARAGVRLPRRRRDVRSAGRGGRPRRSAARWESAAWARGAVPGGHGDSGGDTHRFRHPVLREHLLAGWTRTSATCSKRWSRGRPG